MSVLASDPSQTADIAEQIDEHFANSADAHRSPSPKRRRLDINNSGLDFAAVDRDIALAGMFMVLFLTANGIARSVRERFAEFATLQDHRLFRPGRDHAGVLGSGAPLRAGRAAGRRSGGRDFRRHAALFSARSGHAACPTMTVMVFLWAGLGAALVALGQFRAAGAAAQADGYRNRSVGALK